MLRAIEQNQVIRSTTKLTTVSNDRTKNLNIQVTAMPFACEEQTFVYLIIENLNASSRKRQLIPICSNCLKVRDNEIWLNVEKILSEMPGLNMTHSICPDCKEVLYGPQLRCARDRAKQKRHTPH